MFMVPAYGESASAANGFTRYIFTTAFQLFALQSVPFTHKQELDSKYSRMKSVSSLTLPWAAGLSGFVSVPIVPMA